MRSYRIALAMAVMVVPFASMAQSNPAHDTQASSATAEPESAGDANANSPRSQKSLMGMVMGALIESAEQAARLERQRPPQAHVTSAAAAQHDPIADADPADTPVSTPATQPRPANVQQVAIGSEP